MVSELLKHALSIRNSDDVLMYRENIPKDDQRVPAEGPDEEADGLRAAEARLLQEGQGQEVLAAGGNSSFKQFNSVGYW
jgi:hypothetical protein